MKAKFLIPLILFVILVGFLAVGLNRDPQEIPSPLMA
jgi:cytochrome c biogenesis protein CcmG/thiol:disulfide interchange protein DsbE